MGMIIFIIILCKFSIENCSCGHVLADIERKKSQENVSCFMTLICNRKLAIDIFFSYLANFANDHRLIEVCFTIINFKLRNFIFALNFKNIC